MKYVLAEMVTDRLRREINLVAEPLPKQIRILEAELPMGKVCFETALYRVEKLKKIRVGCSRLGMRSRFWSIGNVPGYVDRTR